MFEKTKGKVLAAVMAVAMAMTVLPTGVIEANAAQTNKVLETNVDFKKNFHSGDESHVYLGYYFAKTDVTFGKTYEVQTKIYVPAQYFDKGGSLWVDPSLSFWTGDDWQTESGYAENGMSYDKKSEGVTKTGDFYVVDAKIPLETCYDESWENKIDFPTGSGKISTDLWVTGENAAYKGSIYFDDAALVVDGNVLLSNDFESGKVNECTYTMNQSEKTHTPKVVGFTGKALDVAKKTLTIKAGKKATIKAATMPNSKVTYKTSNKKVATVTNKGVVKGVKKGKAVITVKANGKTVKVKITVK